MAGQGQVRRREQDRGLAGCQLAGAAQTSFSGLEGMQLLLLIAGRGHECQYRVAVRRDQVAHDLIRFRANHADIVLVILPHVGGPGAEKLGQSDVAVNALRIVLNGALETAAGHASVGFARTDDVTLTEQVLQLRVFGGALEQIFLDVFPGVDEAFQVHRHLNQSAPRLLVRRIQAHRPLQDVKRPHPAAVIRHEQAQLGLGGGVVWHQYRVPIQIVDRLTVLAFLLRPLGLVQQARGVATDLKGMQEMHGNADNDSSEEHGRHQANIQSTFHRR